MQYYLARGLVSGGSAETMRAAARRAWQHDLNAGRRSVLVVASNDAVRDLNFAARSWRIERGDVDPARAVALHDGTSASVGDWVVTRANQRQLAVYGGRDFVKNGDTWTVLGVHPDGSLAVRHHGHAGGVVLPASYVRGDVELAYSATVHRVQGMTTDTSHTLVDAAMTREQLYTSATRGCDTNHLYVITHQHPVDQHHQTPVPRSPVDVLSGVLDRDGVPASATELLRTGHEQAGSLATLVARYNHAARLDDTEHYRDQIARFCSPRAQPTRRTRPHRRPPHRPRPRPRHYGASARPRPRRRHPHRRPRGRRPAALLAWRIQQHLGHATPRPSSDRALPWMARPHDDHGDDLRRYLRDLNTAITHRTRALGAEALRERPAWTRTLGHQPFNPDLRARWNRTLTAAAAYRETFGITDPTTPIGPPPRRRRPPNPHLGHHHHPLEPRRRHKRTRHHPTHTRPATGRSPRGPPHPLQLRRRAPRRIRQPSSGPRLLIVRTRLDHGMV